MDFITLKNITKTFDDVDVLKDAPLDMLKAGYGDIIGKYSALCDWKLSNIKC